MSKPVLTIDLGAAASNWRALDRLSGAADTAAVVKADGYGCGALRLASTLEANGCRSFFVATLDEAIALRGNIALPIHVLNGVADAEEASAAKAHGLVPCLNHLGQVEVWQAAGGGRCALQIDTGMCRLGLMPEELDKVPDNLDATIVMSHLGCADDGPDHPMNGRQLDRFVEYADRLKSKTPNARRSLAATGGTLLGDAFHFDLVRCGIGLHGAAPLKKGRGTVRLDAPILQVRDIPAGEQVGYGASWEAKAASRIATLPLGYADGLHRALSNRGRVFIDGKPARLAGRVSMDLMTIDVTSVDNAQVGTMVEIIGPNQTVDMIADAAGTIGYEILTALGERYEKQYVS